MFYAYAGSEGVKTYTLEAAQRALEMAGVGDFGRLHNDIKNEGAWYNEGEMCGIEKRDGRELRDVEFPCTGDR